ncbi:putative zinc-binding protein [bacterium]|nr:putative zinc-binding protein [bacterium]
MNDKNKEICSCAGDRVQLIFACSGGADVGQLSDLAARRMMADGCGKLFCLAGIGGKVPGILKTTEDADDILVIDGCPVDCAKKSLELAGFSRFRHFQVTALGYEKGGTSMHEEAVTQVAEYGKNLMSS